MTAIAAAPYDLGVLLEPFRVGHVELRNRVVMTGHNTGMAKDGLPTDQMVAYFRDRARGGVGLIGIAFPQIHPSSQNVPIELRCYDPAIVPGLRRMTEAVHEHGAKMVMQLGHTGRQSSSTWSERPLLGPSSVPCPLNREMPKAMEIEDIDEIVAAHAISARHAKAGGMDGVELHSGYGGYLLASFLSPFSNFRDDEYGGSIENRTRFALRALRAVREEVGPDYLVGMNMQGHDFSPGGLEIADAQDIARLIAGTGMLDYVVVKGATYYSASQNVPDMQHPKGVWLDLASAIRDVIDVPVVAVGRVTDPHEAARVLREGGADLIAMTRQHIADPETVTKIREGRLEDLRGCIACNQGCIDRIFKVAHATCVHNPAAGHEEELGIGTLNRAATARRVVVVGGGPAGMKAAETSARAGHEVTLLEARDVLGGQLRVASAVDGRADMAEVIRHIAVQLDKLEVDIRLGTATTAEDVLALDPDHVIVATGSTATRQIVGNVANGILEVPGLDADHVLDVFDVFERGAAVGETVLVVDDGEGAWKAVSVAMHLATRGHTVHLSTPLGYAGAAVGPFSQNRLMPRLFASGVIRHPFSLLTEVRPGAVVLRTEGQPVTLDGIDTVVLAGWHTPVDDVYFALKGRGPVVERVGDAVASRTMLEAVHEGERAARRV